MAEVAAQVEASGDVHRIEAGRKWSQVYGYSFHESLNGCVTQLGEMEKYTKIIVGEQG
jgi:hypothetical protein